MSFGNYPHGQNGSALMRLAPLLLAIIPAIALMSKGCQEGPFGRKQIVKLSVAEEKTLGAQAFNQILHENRDKILPPSAPIVRKVVEIGDKLRKAAQSPEFLKATKLKKLDFQWEFRVIQENQVNAFCLPGGKVVVYTGIIPVCKTEAGLACVMGHEIAHALAHHGAERMAHQEVVKLGQIAAAGTLGGSDPVKQQQVMAILSAGANMGFLLPFSRKHESEADRIGLYLMALAGYDPREAADFWERMKTASGGKGPPEFASTHPSHDRRSADLRAWAPEAMPFFERSPYRQVQDVLLPGPRPRP